MASDRRPDFFIVGQMKSGTTALYEMLECRPDVFMSTPKEPQYFASDLRARFRPEGRGPLPTSLEDYLELFAECRADQICGEASAIYLLSEQAATGIAELQPEAKIISLLREPTALVRSLHLQAIQDHNEDERDLRKALELESARRRGERIPRHAYRPQELFYASHTRYVEQLNRFEAVFPREQMLTIVYDDFRGDNEAIVDRVLRFIGASVDGSVRTVEANPSVMVRSQTAQRWLHKVSTGGSAPARVLKKGIKAVTPSGLRRRALDRAYESTHQTPPPEDEELRTELRRRFKPEVERLSEHLGRDLVSLWGYRDL